MPSPRKEPVTQPESSLSFGTSGSPPVTQGKNSQSRVEDALERLLLKSPGRHNSYSDSTDGDEEVEEAFSPNAVEHNRQTWERSVYHTPSSNLELGRFDSTGQLDDTIHSAFYSPDLSMTRSDLSKRYLINDHILVLSSSLIMFSDISYNFVFIAIGQVSFIPRDG